MEQAIRRSYLGLALQEAIDEQSIKDESEKIWKIFVRCFMQRYQFLMKKIVSEGRDLSSCILSAGLMQARELPFGDNQTSLCFSGTLYKPIFNSLRHNSLTRNYPFGYIQAYADNKSCFTKKKSKADQHLKPKRLKRGGSLKKKQKSKSR